jgi:hypothetical protein
MFRKINCDSVFEGCMKKKCKDMSNTSPEYFSCQQSCAAEWKKCKDDQKSADPNQAAPKQTADPKQPG